MRRVYSADLVVNGIRINEILIDPHYEEKHGKSINDKLICDLVQQLDLKELDPDETQKDFSFFATDLSWNNKSYKLIWLIERSENYIGVINAYRTKK